MDKLPDTFSPKHSERAFGPDDLGRCMAADRHRLRKQWHGISARKKAGEPHDERLKAWHRSVADSIARVERRSAMVPTVIYPDDLPIAQKRQDIIDALQASQVVVVAGETGSGKTTQLPKICLEIGRGINGLIGHTQPRRIAARTVAHRIADELNTPLGDGVGYQVRFTDQSSDDTFIKVMTDGILLAEIQQDRYLSRYDTLIIDEAHERSLNIDFLLGYIKQILPRRPDLKVIITSATIDVERFSHHFDDAPVIEVSGRTYPVEVLYRPPLDTDDDLYSAIVNGVEELLSLPRRGDILIFLSGEREIRETANTLRRSGFRDLEIVPLYARLSLQEQTRVFQPHRGIRVVLATNVAETSITVPGIRYVIDTGLARISRYSYRTKVQRLPIEPVSQASANQRAGRCGRVSDGVCLRLYSEEDYLNRPAFTDPEIVRTNLASVILKMLQMRIGDIREFPFVESPDRRLINDGFQLLTELRAVDGEGQLTPEGRLLSRLPVDPRIGKMLIAASLEGSLREVLVIAAALSIQDPRERPADKRQAADEKHRQWQDKASDFQSLLNLWDHFEAQRQALSRNRFRQYCHDQFVSYLRIREWRDLEHQLRLACKAIKLTENREQGGYNAIHRAITAGLLSHIGFRHDHQEFIGARDRKFVVFPGSGLARKPPKWLVAAELIETSRLFAHQVASIDPDWLPDLAAHLVRKSHSEPHYDPRRGQVMAYEKQTLFGLTIVDRKRVGYSGIDPVQAREVFIRAALVENRYRGGGAFARYNAGLIQELQELEDRLRRRDIVIDDGAIFDFYDARIPSDITNLRAFERWRRKAEGENPRLLFLDRTLLVDRTAVGEAEEQFPKALDWGDTKYTLSYRFEPGHASDGVTVHIPAPQVHQVPDYRFQWLVPGLLRDKCIALVKGLPKQLRKQFVPVPNFVDRALQTMVPDNKPLGPTLGDHLKKHTAIAVPADAWDESAVDDFYRITYCLDDEKGRAIDQDKDLEALKNRHRATVRSAIKSGRGDVRERKGIDRWDFGTLQANTRVRKGKLEIDVFPGLVDEGDSVRLKLFDNPQEAEVESVRGVARLMRLHYPDPARYLRKQLLKGSELPLVAAGFGDPSVLREDIIDAAYQQACLGLNPLPRSEAEFLERLRAGKPKVVGKAQEIERLIMSVLTPLKQLRDAAKRLEERYPEAIADVRAQLDELFCPGFLFAWNEEWLAQYPRYIQAALMRLEKLPGQVEKDRQCLMEIQELRHRWQSLWDRSPTGSNAFRREMETARFMFEEYRVSVFAQVLKTRLPVSPKRIRQQLEKAEKLLSTV